ncbi:ABC transporter ATPase [Flavobacterium aurantiibacter]|uniref:ABC transporter ATPase n=1 Tax=Flavobacterium aurantiibacter TaxID=2023067 RepID=A0A255ZTM1_9FLAO|nr:ABC transporter ATPase [Flavobacterium aurantiibacter]OYQ44843.1 ABC transporter ATPase [Flavobacterium aurantiibacter]
MYVPFEELPEESRVWIYQSNRRLQPEELSQIETALQQFVENWAAHGKPLQASFEIRYDRFIVLAVDQEFNAATGCSIDASVHFIQELEKQFDIVLLDKMNVTYRLGDHIAHKSLIDFKKMVKDRAVSPHTIVFNNLVNTIEEYQNDWEVEASQSWHSRFF